MKKIIIILLLLLIYCESLGNQITKVGIDLIKYFEGFRGKAYKCPANVLTIGYGHTGNDIKENMIITKAEAEKLLIKDLIRFENYINKTIIRIIKWHEFDALISFSYNVGYRIKGRFRDYINEGNTESAVYLLLQYNKAKVNGAYIILQGLVKRRNAEVFLYKTGNEIELRKRYLN